LDPETSYDQRRYDLATELHSKVKIAAIVQQAECNDHQRPEQETYEGGVGERPYGGRKECPKGNGDPTDTRYQANVVLARVGHIEQMPCSGIAYQDR
jgi:hypothetical protein